jgi:hypothetical protein
VPRSQDQNRAVKMTEKTIQRHFHSEFGLEAELVDAGVMDTTSPRPRRCRRSRRPRIVARSSTLAPGR